MSSLAQEEEVTAEFCGEFSPGSQEQQCIECLPCDDPEVLRLDEGLSGFCYEPDSIPEGANYATLKAANGCYGAGIDSSTSTICLPDENPTDDPNLYGEISNATFYRCPDNGNGEPKVDKVTVRCKCIIIETSNIPEGETLTVTVTFEDGEKTYEATVGADGVARVDLPGDRNPTHVLIEYDGETLFDEEVEAIDGPCKKKPVCPDIHVKYKFKHCEWVPVSGDSDGLWVEGDRNKVKICADFPFVVEYATRPKRHGKKKKKKKKKHGKSSKCRKKCEPQEPVTAEYDEETGKCCATIGNSCDHICWFKVRCPENDSNDA
ncbi:hypothetical protein [Haladaptatus sp. NG-WS-4]